VARSLEPYADLLEPVFRDHAIPFVTSARRPLRATPMVKTLERILELPELDYDRAAVLEVLGSGLVRLPPGSDPAQWDLEASQRAIGRGAAAWRERTQGPLRAAFDALHAAVAPLPARGSWRDHASAALRAWEALLAAPVDPAARAALRSLEELDTVREEGVLVDRERFLESLRDRLSRAGEPIGDDRDLDAVQILDVMAARGLCFEHLFLIGLNEKSFPRFIHEEPFLRDHNRRVLADTLGIKLDAKLDGMGEERLLFAAALDSATDTRTLVFQRADDEGRPLSPSPFLREVAYRLPAAQGRRFDEAVGTILSRLPQERLRAVDARRLTPAELLMVRPDLDAVRAELAADGERLARSIAFVRELEGAERLGPLDGEIGADAIDPFWRGYRERVSPTMIETYAACPARALFGRVLKMERFERPEELDEVAPTEMGRLVHAILEGFYREYRPGAEAEPLLRRVWEAECAATRRKVFVRHEAEWEIETARILRALRRFLIEEDLPDLRDLRFEVLPERKGEVRIGGIRYEGYLDRIVVAGTEARVDDYKWKARSDRSERAALSGVSVQLPLYARMAAELLKERPIDRIRARLILLKSLLRFSGLKEITGEEPPRLEEELPEDFWERRGEEFERVLATMTEGLAAGRFFIRPNSNCDWCDFRLACRRLHVPTVRRAEGDPAAAAHRLEQLCPFRKPA
jgi:ATP-dependent helicase/nuclease subunit B